MNSSEFGIYVKEKMLDIVSNSSLMDDENIKTNLYNMSAKNYIESKNNNYSIDNNMLERVAKGGYINDNGFNGVEEGYKPYYNYLKYGIKPYREEAIMIEDNYNNYETPYSFEYEPYMIKFNHEVDTNNTIEMIEEMYNEEPITVEEDVDSNEIIDVLSFLSNKIKEVKKSIIHYISNYRPIMNQYTNTIDTVLIE